MDIVKRPPLCSPPLAVRWPFVTEEAARLLDQQFRSGKWSIYDKSGLLAMLEDEFAAAHDVEHALVTSSGTSALHSAFYSLGIGPGDEVLCPTYTFFATAMPLFQLGALPVLVDCDNCGRFDVASAEAQLTDRTVGIVVTHMWGLPCDMNAIPHFAEKHSLGLIEDCSHAHGASFRGQRVGSFGDVSAWSLQTKKLIPAGEGGVLGTSERKVYDRAQLLGHFNKRALEEMDPSDKLYAYAPTGLGLKYRAHPFGMAVALDALRRLDRILTVRNAAAERMAAMLRRLPGVEPLTVGVQDVVASHYALLVHVDASILGLTAREVQQIFESNGFLSADVPEATTPLHSFTAFREPLSPVCKYKRPSIRQEFPNADRLASECLKFDVPSGRAFGFGNEDEHVLTCFSRIVEKIASSVAIA